MAVGFLYLLNVGTFFFFFGFYVLFAIPLFLSFSFLFLFFSPLFCGLVDGRTCIPFELGDINKMNNLYCMYSLDPACLTE